MASGTSSDHLDRVTGVSVNEHLRHFLTSGKDSYIKVWVCVRACVCVNVGMCVRACGCACGYVCEREMVLVCVCMHL